MIATTVVRITLPCREVAIDLGTSNVRVWRRGAGLVLAEPAVVAQDRATHDVIATGHEARRMLGRTPSRVEVIEPLREGVVHHFEATVALLHRALGRVVGRRVGSVDALVCAPLGVTVVERRALEEAVRRAGAREAYVMEEPLAAAIGAGLPVAEPIGSMIVDLGGGVSEIAVVSLGGLVSWVSIRVGGRRLDEAIRAHLRRRHALAIGPTTAEELKIEVGDASPGDGLAAEVRGRSLLSGLPRGAVVDTTDVAEAMAEPLERVIAAIRGSLERMPGEMVVDVMDAGAMLTGGGSLLPGLADRLRAELMIPVHIADEPLDAVARGAGMALEEMGAIRRAGRSAAPAGASRR